MLPALFAAGLAACPQPSQQDAGGKAVQTAAPAPAALSTIQIPGGDAGIGFDDLRYSPSLARVLVPAGGTGRLDLVDPQSGAITAIEGFGAKEGFAGGHGDGTTSVDEGAGLLFAIDRSQQKLLIIDPTKLAIVSSAPLAAEPDYVRMVAPTRELWVTQPGAEQIEVFQLSDAKQATHTAVIEVKGGPESLVIDAQRGRAYAHLWQGETVAIDLQKRSIVARWPNGCSGSRGIALDAERGFLFIGCAEGRVTVLDVAHDGRQLSSAGTGNGVDIIAYDAARRHLYVPAGKSATLTILGVSSQGELSVLGSFPAAKGSRSATTDGNGRVFVSDPSGGRLLVIADDFPAMPR